MSQFSSGIEEMPAGETPKTSGLAISSLVCSLICCIPPIPLIGLLLGLAGAKSISGNPLRRGMGLAVTGIILGLVFTLGHVGAYFSMKKGYAEFQSLSYETLRAGFDGDVAGMKANFGAGGTAASDADAQAFLDELRNRYGELTGSEVEFGNFWSSMMQTQPGQTVLRIPCVLVFDKARVDAELALDSTRQAGRQEPVYDSIRIIDASAGDLVFPPPSDDGG